MDLFKTRRELEPDNNTKDKEEKKATGKDESSKYEEAFKTGSSIAGTMTSKWNSQENPGKVYVANRRVHHGGIGSVMKLSKHFKKSEPTVTGIISGIGEGLAKDDYADKKEWFKFKKKEDESSSSATETPSTLVKSSESQENSNIKDQQNKSNKKENKTTNYSPI
jgi:hypothetical protein